MGRRDLPAESSATASWIIQDFDLASALSSDHAGSFPAVFATARMVALMELAAARVLTPLLKEGELSVGVHVDVAHTAATPAGATVTAEARFLGTEGKFYRFEVVARDDGGEIGRGTHRRAIIDARRLVDGATRRCGSR
jgi:fluoroacetyl-CoA thioesterase